MVLSLCVCAKTHRLIYRGQFHRLFCHQENLLCRSLMQLVSSTRHWFHTSRIEVKNTQFVVKGFGTWSRVSEEYWRLCHSLRISGTLILAVFLGITTPVGFVTKITTTVTCNHRVEAAAFRYMSCYTTKVTYWLLLAKTWCPVMLSWVVYWCLLLIITWLLMVWLV